MTTVVYPKAIEAMLQGELNLSSGSVKIALVDSADYTYDAAGEFLSDIAGAGRVGISTALSGKDFSDGHFSSDPCSVIGVSGDQFEALVGFLDTGVAGTSRLIWYQNAGVDGLPATPTGGNYTIQPDNTAGIWVDF